MTLVAALLVNDIPILLGDMLISGPERTDMEIGVPTIERSTEVFPEGSSFGIVGMRQKIVVINKNLAVAWAGSVIGAQTLITELIQFARTDQITIESLDSFLEKDAPEIVGNLPVSLVGAVRYEGKTSLLWYNGVSISAAFGFQHIVVAGSGAESFQKVIRDLPPDTQPINRENRVALSLGKALLLTGYLLNLEVGTRDSLLNFYGGGYELATVIDGQFSKIDDIAYVFWYADANTEPGIRLYLPHGYMKAAYKEDVMLIRSFLSKPTPQGEPPRYDENFFIIPGFSSSKRDWTLDDRPSIVSRFLCNYIWVKVAEGEKPEILSVVDFVPSGVEILRLEKVGNATALKINQHYPPRLLEMIRDRLQHKS